MSKPPKPLVEAGIRWRLKPSTMVRELFGVEPDAWQVDVLDAFPTHQRMAMQACRGPGKTTVLAWLAWNFLMTRADPNIAATSVSGENLRDGLLKEMSKWYTKAPLLQAGFQVTTTRIFAKHNPLNWWMSFRTWPKSGDSGAQAQTLAGLHADSIMFILDESSDIPDAVMVAAEAALSSCQEGHILQAGNPTKLEGPLYRASRDKLPHGLWHVTEITGDPDDPKRAPRVSVEWANQQIRQWGRDDPWTIANVFGRFPPHAINTLISEDEVRAAMKRWYRPYEIGSTAPKIMGVDVARQGLDMSVIAFRHGIQMMPMRRYRNVIDGNVGASITSRLWDEYQADACFIDATGGLGFTWLDGLKPLGKAGIPVQFSSKAAQDERYYNKRAEIFFELVHWIKNGGALPPEDSEGARELMEALTKTQYSYKGERLKLEEKDQLKDRIGFSPDEADACALTFSEPISGGRNTGASRRPSYSAVGAYAPFAELDKMVQSPMQGAVSPYDPFGNR